MTPYLASKPTSRRNDVFSEPAVILFVAHAADDVGLQLEIEPVVERLQADQAAGQADARQRIRFRDRRPEHLLVLAADVPHEVDAPRLLPGVGEAQRGERDGDLRRPAIVGDRRRDVPDPVPVLVDVGVDQAGAGVALAFFRDLLLQLRAKRRRHEHVAVARVVEGVENQLEVVFVHQAIRIAAHLGRDNARREARRRRARRSAACLPSYRTRTSVRSVAASPSRGSCCDEFLDERPHAARSARRARRRSSATGRLSPQRSNSDRELCPGRRMLMALRCEETQADPGPEPERWRTFLRSVSSR